MTILKNGKMVKIKELSECFQDIENILNEKDEQIKKLQEEVNQLKDEHYKDEKLIELQNNLKRIKDDSLRGFPISEEEKKSIEEWKMKHLKKMHWDKKNNTSQSVGAIGGRFTYRFIPTGIGVIGEIECTCGEKFCFQEIL